MPKPTGLDEYMPRTACQLPGGDFLSIGTLWDSDSFRQLVHVAFIPAGRAEPTMEFAISADSADALVTVLQMRANETRFINGKAQLEYTPPMKADTNSTPRKSAKPTRKKPPGV